ncbi:annexin A13-like isoform X1 [Ptychodera flava]|uniref:annexin A13-like isoform X1 n=1 Tax=Ptychodera flava TaxID=63121 RepID=UPI003969E42A
MEVSVQKTTITQTVAREVAPGPLRTIMIDLLVVYRGTIHAKEHFDAEADSERLYNAIKGLGTDEKTLIDVLTSTSNEQRQAIIHKYKSMYGQNLEDDIVGDTSGNFCKVLVGLLRTPADFDAECVRSAIEGFGTNEDALIGVLCTSDNDEINAMKEAYKQRYKRNLEKDVESDTSGDFQRLLVSLLQAGRSESREIDFEQALKDARELYEAGEGRWGTDESVFNKIMVIRSYEHLKVTFNEYAKISKRNILEAIDSEMSGNLAKAMRTLALFAMDRTKFYAEALYKSMKGLGTNDAVLIRVIIKTCENSLQEIKKVFLKEYKGTLASWIEGDTSGDYRTTLLALIGPEEVVEQS